MLAIALCVSLAQSVFFVEGRHRLASEPLLFSISAFGISQFRRWFVVSFRGLKKLMESSRRRGTLMISHNDMNAEVIRSFIHATNMSINFINNNPSEIRDFYLEKLQFIIDKFPTDKQKIIIDNRLNISIPKWEFWQKYPEDEFLDLYSWMLERNLIQSGINYNDIVNSSVFL